MIVEVSRVFDETWNGEATTVEVSAKLDLRGDTVTNVDSIHILKATYERQGNVLVFGKYEFVADITPIAYSFFPEWIKEIKRMDGWREAYEAQREIKISEQAA